MEYFIMEVHASSAQMVARNVSAQLYVYLAVICDYWLNQMFMILLAIAIALTLQLHIITMVY